MKSKIDWNAHATAWAASGLNKAEYCRRHGLNQWSFYQNTKSRAENKEALTEVRFNSFPFPTQENSRPAFEFHVEIPFRFRVRINLSFEGGKS